ncbi:collagen-binding domain-containing protein [Saccharothrix syringae]|uniref:Choice-of-anchor A family protein n=1 Tax=Saccharothrix syringae TaxID=103733 RepID=A0A5Q0HAN4_SACSY|nr:collagen-binding domain-containing protein [Saccharothrix syringae]QFZ23306.1 choice-of-anchor A family protein [Saccharothrix syringae]
MRINRLAAAVAAPAVVLGGTPALGAGVAVNPLRPVAPDDVAADPSHGFLVLVETGAELNENETEGPVAVGGDVRFRTCNAGPDNPGTYVLPGDDRPTSLVVGGRLDFAGSPAGARLTVLNQSYAKVGDLSGADVLPSGGGHVRGAVGRRPGRRARAGRADLAAGRVGGRGFRVRLRVAVRHLPGDRRGGGPVPVDGGAAGPERPRAVERDRPERHGLQPGLNVLTLTGA